MKRSMTCIGCPMGCDLTVEIENGEAVFVSGNNCAVGKKYAQTEVSAPMRMVTTTALTDDGVPVPVKTKEPIPKNKIFDVVAAVKSANVSLPVSIGDVIVKNAADTGVDVVASKRVG